MSNLAFADFVEDDVEGSAPSPLVPANPSRPYVRTAPRSTLDFQLQPSGSNKLLDLTMPLLGLAARIRDMPAFGSVEMLHARVTNEIENFQQEATALGYDDATILAARYCLCAMIDESVLSQSWGAESFWPERPMLSVFHNETWGGEKVFGVLDRVMDEAYRFPDLLEFIYFCLTLGFEGRYHVMHNGRAKLDHLIEAVWRQIEKHQGPAPARLVDPEPNILSQTQPMTWRVPVGVIALASLALLAVLHTVYDANLVSRIESIAAEIDTSLNLGEKVAN
jgi:type VI secretion system protein ImpK